MAVVANIVINDAVPAARTFGVIFGGLKTEHRERSSVVADGDLVIKTEFSPATGTRKTDRIDIAVTQPNVAVIDGINQVRDIARVSIQVVLPTGMSTAERATLHAFTKNLLAHAAIQSLMKDRETMW
jgi:hypothetical protein